MTVLLFPKYDRPNLCSDDGLFMHTRAPYLCRFDPSQQRLHLRVGKLHSKILPFSNSVQAHMKHPLILEPKIA